MLHFQMCNILKYTQNSLVVVIPYNLFTAILSDDTITSYLFMRNVFCFNGFNQAPIVLPYSAHIKPRKMIKTIK